MQIAVLKAIRNLCILCCENGAKIKAQSDGIFKKKSLHFTL